MQGGRLAGGDSRRSWHCLKVFPENYVLWSRSADLLHAPSPSPFGVATQAAAGGGGAQRIFGPMVLGIPATEIFADLRVGVGPETGQVVGHLLGPLVGS